MDFLSIKQIEFDGIVNVDASEKVHEKLNSFDFTFEFGKVYLLNSELGQGGWALSWIIGGILEQSKGHIEINYKEYDVASRKQDVWCVRKSEIKRFGLPNQTVKTQVRAGLNNKNLKHIYNSEQEVIEKFHLTPQRYGRPLKSLSHEAWRASCAIGASNGKRIFCFPYVRPSLIQENLNLWLKELIDTLKGLGALVIIPTIATEDAIDLTDEIITMRK